MANEQDIIVRIKAEGAEAFIQQVKKAGVEVEKIGDDAEKTNSRVTSSLKKVGAALATAFATQKVTAFIKESVRLADIQIKAEAQLLKALKGRQDVQQRLLKQAQDIQKTTTFGDEEIIRQQAFLAQLQFTEKQINEIINASINLSAGLGISLDTAVRNTAKTFSGLSGELGELVPQLRGLTQEQLKSGEAVKLLTDLFEGQAATLRTTGAGSIEALQNAVGDLREELGRAVLEGLTPLANNLQDIAQDPAIIAFFRGVGEFIAATLQSAAFAIKVVGLLGSDIASLFGFDPDAAKTIDTVESVTKALEEQRALLAGQKEALSELLSIGGRPAEEIQAFRDGIATTEQNIAGLERQLAGLTKGFEDFDINITGASNATKEFNIQWARIAFEDLNLSNRIDDFEVLAATLEPVTKSIEEIVNGLFAIRQTAEQQKLSEIFEPFLKGAQLATEGIDRVKQKQADAAAELIQKEQERKQAIQSGIDAQTFAFGTFAQFQQRELAILEERYQQGIISEKQYQQERREILQKQARAQKVQSIFEAGLNAKTAITSALKAGPIAGPILAAVIGALAAAQIAAIASTPIPQFAKGTKGKKKAPAGFKWVGEEGPELLYDGGGYNILTAKDSDQIAKMLGSYGIPTTFKNNNSIVNKLDMPLKTLKQITKDSPLEGLDWGPMLNASDRSRMSLGRKLDKIHTAIVKGNSNRVMTRA